jgi:hypothetical protein
LQANEDRACADHVEARSCHRAQARSLQFPEIEFYFEPLKLYTRFVVNSWSECSAPGAISLL